MKLEDVKLLFKLVFLIIGLSSCSDNEVPIFYPDVGLQEVREHKIIDYEALILSPEPVKIWPLSKADDLVCTTLAKGRKLKEDVLKYKKNCVCN